MYHKNHLDLEKSVLLIVDVQERFRGHIFQFEIMINKIVTLVEASKILPLPGISKMAVQSKGVRLAVPRIWRMVMKCGDKDNCSMQ